jgi:hypothetical protein
MNQLGNGDNIFSAKSKKLKKEIANKPYWDNTHPTQSSIQQQEDDNDEDEEKRPKGYALLMKVYGGSSKATAKRSEPTFKANKQNVDLLIPANKILKNEPIYQFSNPKVVQKKAFQLYGKNAIVYKSKSDDKKYQILNENTGKYTHFGQMGYEDFTKHQDLKRRDNYLKRSLAIKGNWDKNPYSANFLSIFLLW